MDYSDLFFCSKEDKKWQYSHLKSEDEYYDIDSFWRDISFLEVKGGELKLDKFIFPYINGKDFKKVLDEFTGLEKVSFKNAIFQGQVNFDEVYFNISLDFTEAIFEKEISCVRTIFKEAIFFEDTTFGQLALFSNTLFKGSTFFKKSTFNDKADFTYSEFHLTVSFEDSTFIEEAIFNNTIYRNGGIFNKITFLKEAFFRKVIYIGRMTFWTTTFKGLSHFSHGLVHNSIEFNETHFNESIWEKFKIASNAKVYFTSVFFDSEKRFLFQDWKNKGRFNFDEIVFPDKVQFQRCSMENIGFKDCDLSKIYFSDCFFAKKKGRIVLQNEFDEQKNYEGYSTTYRQLKKNFADKRDWENAGDAYRSEMIMKRKALFHKIKKGDILKLPQLIVMLFYEGFSGGLRQAIITSLNTAFPFAGKIDTTGYAKGFYFLLFTERLLSILLLTFFGLAVRARLRQ